MVGIGMVASRLPPIVRFSANTGVADDLQTDPPAPTRTRMSAGSHVPATHVPPFVLHDVPSMTGGFSGLPMLHRSSVHALPSTSGSVSSFWIVKPPVPSHTLILQSPGLWFAI